MSIHKECKECKWLDKENLICKGTLIAPDKYMPITDLKDCFICGVKFDSEVHILYEITYSDKLNELENRIKELENIISKK